MSTVEDMHSELDDLWRSGHMTRSSVYAMIAAHLGIPAERAHTGRMSEGERRDVLAFLKRFRAAVAENIQRFPGGIVGGTKAPLSATLGERLLRK